MPPRLRTILTLLLTFGTLRLVVAHAQGTRSESPGQATYEQSARRVILFIGDGMGDSEITLARYYSVGAAGRLAMDALPFTGSYTTYSVEETNPRLPNYVPDSAATGTAWATGRKTSNGRISTAAGTGSALKTIIEIARERGWRTGDVTTAELTDATPAVLAAHVLNRSCQGPADMIGCPKDLKETGGLGSIAEQMVEHDIDVLLGGGRARFEQLTQSRQSVVDIARARGYRVVTTGAELAAAEKTPVLGLFAPGNMALDWNGQEALPYPSNVRAPQQCLTGLRPTGEPSLAAMTTKALSLLERASGDSGHFFLQVEGASIDKQNHAANPCGQIGETVAFDHAVQAGIDYAHAHPDTLLIVTADHGHTSQIVATPTDTDHPTGLLSVLLTVDGALLTVSYGTNGYHRSQDHTGTQVRIAAMGPQAAHVVGLLDQTDLFRVIVRAMSGSSGDNRSSE